MNRVFITTEYITLGQFLKYTGLISAGSEAKTAILTLEIRVNGALEDRRGRKIYPGDIVKIEKNSFMVVLKDENQRN